MSNQPLTVETIDQAITWYEANKDAIIAALPIVTPGVTYLPGREMSVDRYIALWQQKELSLNLADCYIRRPIRHFYSDLKSKQIEESE